MHPGWKSKVQNPLCARSNEAISGEMLTPNRTNEKNEPLFERPPNGTELDNQLLAKRPKNNWLQQSANEGQELEAPNRTRRREPF